MKSAFILGLLLMLGTPQEVITASFRTTGGGGGSPTVTSAVCVANTGTATANCALAATVVVGDLLVIKSKTANSGGTPAMAITYSGTTPCTASAIIAPVLQGNGPGTFAVAESGCIVTTGGTITPVATWTGGGVAGSFTDIQAFTIHTSTTWKSTFVDKTATNVASSTSTTCSTGTTAATTTANDFIYATCDVFNAAQTWGALGGFTQYAAASRNTAGAYYKVVTSTGTQTAAIPLSSTDFGAGLIAAFASN